MRTESTPDGIVARMDSLGAITDSSARAWNSKPEKLAGLEHPGGLRRLRMCNIRMKGEYGLDAIQTVRTNDLTHRLRIDAFIGKT